MKYPLVVGLIGLALTIGSVRAQTYHLNWSAIGSGGGIASGGVFSVSGTIGQPDIGATMSGGQYSLVSGFWALPSAVQTPGAPTLAIANTPPGSVTISWQPPNASFTLQFSDSLPPTTWTNAPSGTNNPAVVPTTQSARFYRLFKR